MKLLPVVTAIVLYCLISSTPVYSEVWHVGSQQEFNNAHDNASTNDSIIWTSGTYSNIRMDIDKDDLSIMAEELGSVIMTGVSRVNITADNILFQGFQYLSGTLGTLDVINVTGSHVKITQINIKDYTCFKYLRVREESQYVEISYCNFENRLNLDDQNILSILVDQTTPGYHKIQHCSFKNFDGTGNDLGIEPIRIGLSTQANRISRTVVENCYFTQCNGDGEIISSKASQNVYRYNTFENNPKAELVLRHGSEAIVYGNFFLDGKGGIRVREGSNHYIYNNYFYQLEDRSIYLQNDDSDPLKNIHIAFNTFVDCAEFRLGGNGNDPPTDVTISNNIFTEPIDDIFREETGTETWIGNIAFGDLGIPLPSIGISTIDPGLEENSEGFFGLAQNSSSIDAAQAGFAKLPEFMGIENIDSEILFDMMKQDRPASIAEKDLGSNEYPHTVQISPFATEENTGPSYDTSLSLSSQNTEPLASEFIKIKPNPISDYANFEVVLINKGKLTMDIMNSDGMLVDTISEMNLSAGKTSFMKYLGNLPSGLYTVHATNRDQHNSIIDTQTIKIVKL